LSTIILKYFLWSNKYISGTNEKNLRLNMLTDDILELIGLSRLGSVTPRHDGQNAVTAVERPENSC
jgi:hypothetical protein